MSDQQERPLSRRELREREGWLAEDANLESPAVETEPIVVHDPAAVPETASIPTLGPDGQPLSRRQLRELWLAQEEAAQAEAVQAEAVQAAEVPETEQAAASELVLDTEPDSDTDVVDEVESEHKPIPAPKQRGFSFPWNKAPKEEPLTESSDETASEPELSADAEPQEKPEAEPEAETATEAETETEPAPAPYVFPDVSPLPESRSIFDHQETPAAGFTPTTEITTPSEPGAFDDIITRAVADEGAASPTNTSALILPVMPDTTEISGTLNETGEILLTGSIELPKDLVETGGHSQLLDPVDAHEAVVLGHEVHEVVAQEMDQTTQPVSASRAVSAQASHNAIVSPAPKRDSKLPLILAVSAGGLLVTVVAVFVWAASTGQLG